MMSKKEKCITCSLRCSIHIEQIQVNDSEDIADELSAFAPDHLFMILEAFIHENTNQRNNMMCYRKLVLKIV
jgi:hypothetical protein